MRRMQMPAAGRTSEVIRLLARCVKQKGVRRRINPRLSIETRGRHRNRVARRCRAIASACDTNSRRDGHRQRTGYSRYHSPTSRSRRPAFDFQRRPVCGTGLRRSTNAALLDGQYSGERTARVSHPSITRRACQQLRRQRTLRRRSRENRGPLRQRAATRERGAPDVVGGRRIRPRPNQIHPARCPGVTLARRDSFIPRRARRSRSL